MSKKSYIEFSMTPIGMECRSAVLAGSVTNVAIEVENVTVNPYEQGFGTTPSNDFQEISFD